MTHARDTRGCSHRTTGTSRHDYSYVAPFNFPGYWSVTPGRYYWQASYDSDSPLGIYWSGIGSFVVK